MATLIQQLKRAEKLTPEKIVNDVFKFIRSIEKELVAYNQSTLFNDSEDIFGKPIGFYSSGTEIITKGQKKAGEPFDLKDTGDLLESIFSKVQNDSIFFGATDPKLKDVLKNTLSDDLFGLQDEDLNQVIKTRILPFLQGYIRKGLGI
ncbi:hypothetical protein [Polaribacter aestuariivivens]|uniref:hypothetical protein n=1 Tax=Polaribacter aestuariivivens TaxID=2304626 RepID=UPI003F49A06E